MSVVTTDWLEKNLSEVKIIDCSWHMPGINRNPKEEYLKNHIPGAIFFDLSITPSQLRSGVDTIDAQTHRSRFQVLWPDIQPTQYSVNYDSQSMQDSLAPAICCVFRCVPRRDSLQPIRPWSWRWIPQPPRTPISTTNPNHNPSVPWHKPEHWH